MYRLVLLAVVATATSRNIDLRILGGKPVKIEEYPFQVSLQTLKDHFCGGVIIKPTYILTTALCIYRRRPDSYQVRYGTDRRKEGGSLKDVDDHKTYPSFEIPRHAYDVGVITLSTPIIFSMAASPVSFVPLDRRPHEGNMLVATGWGYTQYKTVLSDQLRAVRIPVIGDKLCAKAYWNYVRNVTGSVLCAGGGIDSGPFAGDTGGPLINERNELVGLTSWGFAWGNVTGYPVIFTDMTSRYIRVFINDQIFQ